MSRKQGLPERGRGAPGLYGDLTAEADIGGRQPHASVSGRISIKSDGAPAPLHRPPRAVAGMRPPAIAASHRLDDPCTTTLAAEVTA